MIQARDDAASFHKQLEESQQLVARLEGDLEERFGSADGGSGGRSGSNFGGERKNGNTLVASSGGSSSAASQLGGDARGKVSGGGPGGGSMDLSELLGVTATGPGKVASHRMASAAEGDGKEKDLSSDQLGGSSNNNSTTQMVVVLQAQRDRYKERLALAEASAQTLSQQLASAQTFRTQLEADNLALYGKIRFLQSTGGGGSGGGSTHFSPQALRISRHGQQPRRGSRSLGEDEEAGGMGTSDGNDPETAGDLGRYQALYEQKMNPFAEVCRKCL